MAVSNEVIGTYGVWVSRGRIPLVNHWRPDSVVPVRRVPLPGPWKKEAAETPKTWADVRPPPPPAPPPPPPQPPPDDMDPILLEYAKAAGISTKGYWNDRAYWRRQIGWAIKQHADRLRYK